MNPPNRIIARDNQLFDAVLKRHEASNLELQVHRYSGPISDMTMQMEAKATTDKPTSFHLKCEEIFKSYPIGKFRCALCREVQPLSSTRNAHACCTTGGEVMYDGLVCHACFQTIPDVVTGYGLYVPSENGPVLYTPFRETVSCLKNLSYHLDNFTLDDSVEIYRGKVAAIRIQAAVRGFLVRRRVRQVKREYICLSLCLLRMMDVKIDMAASKKEVFAFMM